MIERSRVETTSAHRSALVVRRLLQTGIAINFRKRQRNAERRQFDSPLRDFQAIQFKLADMATRVSASRALLHLTAQAKDRGANVKQACSMAKLLASETAMFCTNQAVQIFGGYGYVKDYPVERYFRDAKVTEIYEGTSEIQREIIARTLGL